MCPRPKEDSELAIDEELQIKEPPEYAVLLHNDDYTTMDFVIEVLMKYFSKSGVEAGQIMMQIHQKGKGVAGVYSFEIAETKVAQVTEEAKSKGFPLQCTLEPV